MQAGPSMTAAPFKSIAGPFFRCVPAARLDGLLAAPVASSAGRYHRLGQPALYLSPRAEWAIMAVSGYMREDGLARVVVPVDVGAVAVFDQHDEEACRKLGIDRELSNASWRTALTAGEEPPSWRNADAARRAGADGIIDRSRLIPGGWHLTLFRWNALGGPHVRIAGKPVPVRLSEADAKWGL